MIKSWLVWGCLLVVTSLASAQEAARPRIGLVLGGGGAGGAALSHAARKSTPAHAMSMAYGRRASTFRIVVELQCRIIIPL